MTIRKLWLIALISIAVIAIGINALVMTTLTDDYFKDYLNDTYENHVKQILDYTTNAISDDNVNYNRMFVDLETHLVDPIISIKLYDPSGKLLVSVFSDYHMNGSMGSINVGRGMFGMNDDKDSERVDQHEITYDGKLIAIMNITLHSDSDNSFIARKFKNELLINSLTSIALGILVSIIFGIFISKWMTKSLKDTQSLAYDLELGEKVNYKSTNIKEINSIRDNLLDLNVRLRLKQKTRKSLIDQLVHQTRTPLTILKSHIEAFEDGIIEVNDVELNICKNQIDNIDYIITNMSAMIDAKVKDKKTTISDFEISNLLDQIVNGLKPQFAKKKIKLSVTNIENIRLISDRELLSQSIYNILTNAYKYTNGKGFVEISYAIDQGLLRLKIRDTGIGISDADIDNIFDAYYRSSEVVNEKGEGIGLFIAKENIEKLGGTIDIVSNVGAGSTFTIIIPLEFQKD